MAHPSIDTVYPESQVGEPFGVVPPPLSPELQRRLTELGAQDVGTQ